METKNYRIGNKVQVSLFENEKDFKENVEDTYIKNEWFIGEIESIEPFNPDYTYSIDLDTNEKHANNIDEWQRVDPIPLTEEWIKKAGFKQNTNKLFDLKIFRKGIYFISISEKGNMFGFKQSADEQYTPIKELKYVHKLQNIYFELEDSELVFSEA